MAHDFKNFPELTNRQMQIYYFDSPHQQIFEDFDAKVIGVHDGDTIRVEVDFRDFSFPIRLSDLAVPEIDELGGLAARDFLRSQILGETVEVRINKRNRVEKWGRLLGEIFHGGISLNEQMIQAGYGIRWA